MRCEPYSLFSALFLLVCAGIAQSLQGYPDCVSVCFLLVGVTSVIHHCRLDTWWKQDAWRCLDYVSITIFVMCACARFGYNKLWWSTCIVLTIVAALIWSGYVPQDKIARFHALIHIVISICVLYLVASTPHSDF